MNVVPFPCQGNAVRGTAPVLNSDVIAFPARSVHLWLHATAGGWVAVAAGTVDPDWPTGDTEWLPTTKAARTYAKRLAARHGLSLAIHAGEF